MLLTSIAAVGCGERRVTSLTAPLILPDSIRYVTPCRDQPYALLWPQNGVMNLWLRVSATRACRVGIEDRYYRREYSAVLRGTLSGSTWVGELASATDSSVSGSFTLQAVTPDSMAGLAVMRSADNCGACLDSIPLTLVRP